MSWFTEKNTKHDKLIWIVLAVPSLLTVLSIWLVFGFTSSGLIEEWGILQVFTTNGLFFVADTTTPFAAFALRPLFIFPFSLAYFLSSNSFIFWHILLMLALFVKGAASSQLIFRSTGSLWWAIVMGILVLIYPADTAQLGLRILHINWALALLLMASLIIYIAFQQKRIFASSILGVISSALLFTSICIYEAALVLVLLPFMMMFVKDGLRSTFFQLRSRIGLTLIWFTGAGLYLAYVLVVSRHIAGGSYQQSLAGDRNLLEMVYYSFPKLFSPGALRGLLGGWFDATRMVFKEVGHYGYLYLIVTTGVMYGFALLVVKANSQSKNKVFTSNVPIIISFRLILVGFLLLIFGFLPSLVSASHLSISQRTYLYATPGAAMFWIGVLSIIAHGSIKLVKFLVVILIFIGLGAQLFQFHHYAQISDTQRKLLKNIVENFDGNLGGKTLVFFDESNQLNHTWMLRGNLSCALTYIYEKPINGIHVCKMPSGEWQQTDDLDRKGTCIENKNSWVFRYPVPVKGPKDFIRPQKPDLKIAKSQIIGITIKSDGSISPNPLLNNYRDSLLKTKNNTAKRYRNILASRVWPLNFIPLWASNHLERYKWNFGNWWNLEIPIRGSGWREADWEVKYFYHHVSAWKTQENALLLFDLLPKQSNYFLRGRIESSISETIRKSIRISINHRTLSYNLLSNGEFVAEIPCNTLKKGINSIEFYSNIDPYYFGLSLKLDWFEIYPGVRTDRGFGIKKYA